MEFLFIPTHITLKGEFVRAVAFTIHPGGYRLSLILADPSSSVIDIEFREVDVACQNHDIAKLMISEPTIVGTLTNTALRAPSAVPGSET